ncbi:long-chain fatty acid transport protein [Paraperlucidibaca baekdonensis]|uniref:Long-chain fatty acid transport protein n=1 Tax=Paraperlucidibaca baekdonensis TaxID=748120 RepID=A0A3E0H1T6_9GAMM|nr:outer membrane protein transport protein [Paraperlucidibaca baekdonensis]REH36860.1 long-chain fatty acid transport protein [Paraperlucidibaca baekdonensis]
MVSQRPLFTLRALTFSMLSLAASSGIAGGLDLPTITASHQGTSNANGAEANDPSVLYYNPAGLARLKGGLQVSQGFSLLILNGKVEADKAGSTGTPQMGDTEGRSLENDPNANGEPGTFWPRLLGAGGAFISLPVDDIVTVGLGVFAPGGGNLNYKSNWTGAYQIDSIAIELININPSIGIRFDEQHSLGLGVSVIGGHIRQRTQIDVVGVEPYLLKSALDNDTLPVPTSQVCTLLPPLCTIGTSNISLVEAGSTGSAKVEMYGYGLGFNLGYMFAVNDKTRFGLAYRSESTMKMRGKLEWDLSNVEGNSTYSLLQPALGGATLEELLRSSLRPDTTAKGDLILPARTSANFFHKLNDKIDLMADFTFIETSAVDKIRVEFLDVKKKDGSGTIKQGAGGIDTKWKDSFKVSVGGNYHYDDKLTLKSGFQYDKTPVPSAEYRHPGAPDSDRYMFSVGANYKLKKNLTLDAAYSVTFLADSESNYRDRCRVTSRENEDGTEDTSGNAEPCTGNGGTFKGRFYDTSIQTLGIQMNQKF